ncbi:hypothetical protein MRB53_040297 [Persea americana]|nr:hypothetical protein MRB53_040297 [Persea americana]
MSYAPPASAPPFYFSPYPSLTSKVSVDSGIPRNTTLVISLQICALTSVPFRALDICILLLLLYRDISGNLSMTEEYLHKPKYLVDCICDEAFNLIEIYATVAVRDFSTRHLQHRSETRPKALAFAAQVLIHPP